MGFTINVQPRTRDQAAWAALILIGCWAVLRAGLCSFRIHEQARRPVPRPAVTPIEQGISAHELLGAFLQVGWVLATGLMVPAAAIGCVRIFRLGRLRIVLIGCYLSVIVAAVADTWWGSVRSHQFGLVPVIVLPVLAYLLLRPRAIAPVVDK